MFPLIASRMSTWITHLLKPNLSKTDPIFMLSIFENGTTWKVIKSQSWTES